MNCFNHPNEPAVAQCTVCGKFLCKKCAEKYKPIMCDECVTDQYVAQNAYEEATEKTRKTRGMISLGIIAVFLVIGIAQGSLFSPAVLFGFALAGFPYGFRATKKFIQSLPIALILPIPAWVAIALIPSLYIGWIFMIIDLVKMFASRSKNK